MRFDEGPWTLPQTGGAPVRIAPADGGVDLARAESYVLAMPFDEQGRPAASPDTAALYRRLADWLDAEVPAAEREAVAATLGRALPSGERARGFADGLRRFRAYRTDEAAIIDARLPRGERQWRLDAARARRFGPERAAGLFAASTPP